MASIFGASNGIASCNLACSSSSVSSTKRNSACGSTNRLINHGQATRSTLMSFRVIHFITTSRAPRVCELDGETIFVVLGWVGGDQAGKTLARCIDKKQIAVRAVVPAQTNVRACCLCVGSVHLKQCGKCQETRKRIIC